jgi:S1-C subfamily serine protease
MKEASVTRDPKALPFRARRIAAALAVVMAAAAPARAEGPIVELIAAVKPSVVAVGGDGTPVGSGFAVGDGAHVLTALHLLRGSAGGLSVRTGQGEGARVQRATQVAADPDNDLALLKIEGAPLPPLRLFLGRQLSEGEEVAVSFFPADPSHGPYPVTHRGVISSIRPVPGVAARPVTAYQLDAAIVPGGTGGPVVDPADGAVVGVVNGAYAPGGPASPEPPPGVTFAMPIPPAIDLLRKAGQEP